jgi:hypothetical protein
MMFKWLHHLLNPHCEHCLDEKREEKVCPTCEVLSRQLEVSNQLNRDLLNKLTDKPVEVERKFSENPSPIMSRHIPFSVRRQTLERESRIESQLKKEAPKPVEASKTNEELEKEIGIVQEEVKNAG